MPYATNFAQQPQPNFGGFPVQGNFQAPGGGTFGQWGAQPQPTQYPVQQNTMQFPGQFQGAPFGQFQTGAPPTFNNAGQVPNPFYGNQNGVQQQLANLNLNSQSSSTAAPTLATNIWQ